MKYRYPVFLLTLCTVLSAGCTAVHENTCFIYTDGLLDDLCAIEYLAQKYDHAVIMPQNPAGIAGSPYASSAVTDEAALLDTASEWFVSAELYSDEMNLSEADLYLLAPLSEFAELLKDNPYLCSEKALMMAGDTDGPDGAGNEWNAAADIEAYRYVTENMKNLTQMTRSECEQEYEKDGYPFEARFLDEYTSRMNAISENICCYDLQAAAFVFK